MIGFQEASVCDRAGATNGRGFIGNVHNAKPMRRAAYGCFNGIVAERVDTLSYFTTSTLGGWARASHRFCICSRGGISPAATQIR